MGISDSCASLGLGIVTPHAFARAKAIGFVSVVCRHKVLAICAFCSYYRLESAKIGLCVHQIVNHGSLVLQIMHFLFSMPVVY